MASFPENLVACPGCDLLQRIPPLPPGGRARCPRCREVLASGKSGSPDRCLALTVAAAIVFLVVNAMPLMRLSVVGREASTTILGGTLEMFLQGEKITAVLVAFCVVLAPAVQIWFLLGILLGARRSPAPSWAGTLLRWWEVLRPWSMLEVMMLGILVALVKISELASVTPGIGAFATGALIFLLAAINVSFDPHEVWARVRWVGGGGPRKSSGGGGFKEGKRVSRVMLTGLQAGLISCETCSLLSRPASLEEAGHCPRCGEELAFRRPNSMQRTWALIIGAAICYLPANILPVMLSTTTFGSVEEDTIISGVILLYATGSWDLALIVLIASVMIPLAKLFALGYLLITVQRGSIRSSRERVRLYRLVEIVGRWSMLDVFVITFTVALIQLQPLMSVDPGPGVLFFAAVVVLTMFAAESFDPRLIWDSSKGGEDAHG
jgi:paraquat-inducible protein A